ncbi:OmpA family protein [Acidocella sp.]|jgi:outer membrane protein OmpA-like peptidoglycan-associated protein|uniref:OmpA family protein n=1 Tax=Acidocella sp. TaxID=50710 RepID=UPI002604AEC9|nr:OmpA family protein [Acidocella sp.]
MKKIIIFSMLAGLGGCASAPQTPPATPVFFQPWSAALDQPALTTIATVAKAANAQPDAPVEVTGAADSVGDTQANEQLAQARAQAVANQLVADGVARERLRVDTVGEIKPKLVAPGTPVQADRRVLIRIGG